MNNLSFTKLCSVSSLQRKKCTWYHVETALEYSLYVERCSLVCFVVVN